MFVSAGTERFAVPAAAVIEVVPAVRLHPLAGGPRWVAGVFVFRGAVTPVLDLNQLVTGTACPDKLSARIVVVGHATDDGPAPLGLLAERVTELKPLAATGAGSARRQETDGPDLGPLVADADGMLRLPDVSRLVPAAYRSALFARRGGPAP
ncbi:Chemotaxis signal transduction protein [Fimbriiglobus ruber]|uniref:Chemotaxis signal transduction protein n=1 Tax=Fimbriiglobus ruber TaxID=1908690 RepID=A0A225DBR1_9BACT|nr:Chemotaxis signal transduction protein [Fimbriiglobus ruber]